MSGQKTLTQSFLAELIKACLTSDRVMSVVNAHLKYTMLPATYHKLVWKFISDTYSVSGKVPSIGVVGERFSIDSDVQEFLVEVSKVTLPKRDQILVQFELFIQQTRFVQLYHELGDLWNKGDRDQAVTLLQKSAESISAFSIRDKYYEPVFSGLERRVDLRDLDRLSGNNSRRKVPFGIWELDRNCKGGMSIDDGDTALFTAQSGTGKTKVLRHIGVNAARLGHKVLHVSAEGSKRECEIGYDSAILGLNPYELVNKALDPDRKLQISNIVKNVIVQGGEIFIEAFESFGLANLSEVRFAIEEIEKVHGPIDLILLDYLEKFNPISSHNWRPGEERARREMIAEQIKNTAVEKKKAIVTATQASSVHPSDLNDPNFVMTRHNIAEVKKLIDSFAFHITLNQTKDEYAQGYLRLYEDKLRHYLAYHTIRIAQSPEVNRFYNHARTMKEIHNMDPRMSH